MSLYADLHRHLGGALHPRIIYKFLQKNDHHILNYFPEYDGFYNWFTRPCRTLDEFVKIHTLVEELQNLDNLEYFCFRLCRGAYLFENLQYLELRYNPYFRTDKNLDIKDRIRQMQDIINVISKNVNLKDYPIIVKQILCLDRRLPKELNEEILNVAIKNCDEVVGIDLAGPEIESHKFKEWLDLFKLAKMNGLKTTCHLGETSDKNIEPEFFDVLDRIGHGIHIPLKKPEFLSKLAQKQITLEICPTSYRQTGVIQNFNELKIVFDRCRESGVPIAICTDNPGRNPVPCTLPGEYERLIDCDVISFSELRNIQRESFKSAFGFFGKPNI